MLGEIEIVTSREEGVARELLERTRRIGERLAPGIPVMFRSHAAAPPAPGASRTAAVSYVPWVHVNGQPIGGAIAGAAGTPPPDWMIEAAIVHALEPKHILFMCVANSSRSQMAEGMARALASPELRISSAGSQPTTLRPEAVHVLREIGIDISDQRAKATDAVDIDTVQLVITLCAEEVCPVILIPVPRLHWPIPDPAIEEGGEEQRREAYRKARDMIRERLYVLLHG